MKEKRPTHRSNTPSTRGRSTRATRSTASSRSDFRPNRVAPQTHTRTKQNASSRPRHITSIPPTARGELPQYKASAQSTYSQSNHQKPSGSMPTYTPRPSRSTEENSKAILTRRQLLFGAAGIAGVAGIGFAANAYSKNKKSEVEFDVLSVPEESVYTTEAYDGESVSAEDCMSLVGSFTLPYGTLVWANSSHYAACLIPTETAAPLSEVGILSFSSGTCEKVLKQAVTEESGWEIYDVRANDAGLIWTEAHCLANTWKVYQATYTPGTGIGEAILMAEGDQNFEAPSLAIVDKRVFWQVLPALNGEMTHEDSLIMTSPLGKNDPQEVHRSHGRMCTPLYALADSIVATPRVDTEGVYHQLTTFDAKDLSIKDSLILPGGMKPLEAGYCDGKFSFAFDAIYNYGGGIANLGTYVPLQQGNPSDSEWFRFDRNPSAAPAWCGRWFVVKSTRGVSCIDTKEQIMFSLGCPDDTEDYGDYLASTGCFDVIATYCNIHTTREETTYVESSSDGSKTKGEYVTETKDVHHTLVRVWKPIV